MQDIIANTDEKSNIEILKSLRQSANMMAKQRRSD